MLDVWFVDPTRDFAPVERMGSFDLPTTPMSPRAWLSSALGDKYPDRVGRRAVLCMRDVVTHDTRVVLATGAAVVVAHPPLLSLETIVWLGVW